MSPMSIQREWVRKHVISGVLVVTLAVSAFFHWAANTVSREAVAAIGAAVITEQAVARDVDARR